LVTENTQRRRDAARTRAGILEAAVAEFALRGPTGTRVEEVASRAGVNKSLIYQYFGSKQELYTEVLTTVLARVTERATEFTRAFVEGASGGELKTYLRAFLDNHLRLLEAVPEYPRLMAWENLQGGATLARVPVKNTYDAFLSRVAGLLQPLRAEGQIAARFDFARTAQVVMAVTHFYVVSKGTQAHLFRMDLDDPATREGWIDHCAHMLSGLFLPEMPDS
jgi:AcrR family transcriptional regulator